ncbi:MAG TPA: hypothetical protein PLD47_13115 [Aggregatilineales bacterium]|nr:hypothetical protein [Anaerolineales bacterium]HRE48658.1 hypothetical protein [Aggregatilineales bacterium]
MAKRYHLTLAVIVLFALTFSMGGTLRAQSPEQLDYGDTLVGFITKDAPVSFYQFKGAKGDPVTITVESVQSDLLPAFWVYETAKGEPGKIGEGKPAADGKSAMLDVMLPADGDYSINVVGSKDTLGDFIITLSGPPEPDYPLLRSFNVKGQNPNGTTFEGILTITDVEGAEVTDTLYVFDWQFANQTIGLGLRKGNYIAVAYSRNEDSEASCGVALFEKDPNDKNVLNGQFADVGDTIPGTETLTKADGDTYDVIGEMPNGEKYKDTLTLVLDGEAHIFTYLTNDVSGVAIEGDNYFAASYGTDCVLVFYHINADGSMDGYWTEEASEALLIGSEKATPRK